MNEVPPAADLIFPDDRSVFLQARLARQTDPERAEEIYRRGLMQFPRSALLHCGFAVFLRRVHGDHDQAEEHFRLALEIDPNHVDTLGDYANFLWVVRDDLLQAEELFQRAISVDPHHGNNRSSYATFLWLAFDDAAGAETMYQRAIVEQLRHPGAFANYAMLLADARHDFRGGKALFRTAFRLGKETPFLLGAYANFLTRFGMQRAADVLYRRSVQVEPYDPNILIQYALLAWDLRRDRQEAIAFFEQAVKVQPNHPRFLGQYAEFLQHKLGDDAAAAAICRRALQTSPRAISRLHLAEILLSGGDREGLEHLSRAEEELQCKPDASLGLVAAFLRFAHGPHDERHSSLSTIGKLLGAGVTCRGWKIERNVERACNEGHPEADWLKMLGRVAIGNRRLKDLDDWPAWQSAADRSNHESHE